MRRSDFLQRISSVGWGARQAVQALLGATVSDLRTLVLDHAFTEDEMEAVSTFHDRVEDLWRRTLASNPPVDPVQLVTELQDLLVACSGPLSGFRIQVEDALRKARALLTARDVRKTPPDSPPPRVS